MTGSISATEGALRRGAEAVSGARADIVDSIGRVRGELDQLSAYWQGGAATAFQSLVSTWSADAQRLTAVLVEFDGALRGTERDQAATEDAHQQTISGLGTMMGGS
ncbi:MAG: WXG100 family type VII secretion target [Microbacterium sp.]|jgi:WXG100 family type VII secretion target|uniref:ESAT-6-like protein n=1 Tax=Microbacterium ginsengisoli TaxID=400772 RepID=A0A0F0LYT3_9MICO|nr:WXG100 family type VII secretion target [Microbacterium ginsengisoli]KJL45146.1 hypothetical protein RR49_00078 [Microbacterium ginsengisoli]MAL05959.1 WXG100 family type VII secretion target [Microbacterium sp.]MBN9207498.1 WXG100 family type VII secretion target [Microbacterium ginsengisoli]HAN25385.1 WXG100 family type VII secretion target [Microbacterium ginsengisoli]